MQLERIMTAMCVDDKTLRNEQRPIFIVCFWRISVMMAVYLVACAVA